MEDKDKCAHCNGTGSCSSGKDGTSCAVCIKEHKLDSTSYGVVCSVCLGLGIAENKSQRIQNRIAPLLALSIVFFTLAIVASNTSNPNFDKILPFAAALIGSITGFYFGGKSWRNKS